MKELSFNGIKNKIHLKKCILNVKRKDSDYHKMWNLDKLTFYKDYKYKMLWFNTYGIGLDNLNFKEIEEDKKYLIETDKSIINISLEVEDENKEVVKNV
jgi:hypothetical protein|tara:strand:- start:44507 stop:44803 length:297 start_codon:yes stop_codon:yes gene_type:complete